MISNIVFSLVIVAEVTQPSTGVGYELGRAVAMNKRILCLYRPQENKRKLQKNTYTTQLLFYIRTYCISRDVTMGKI